MTNDGLTQQTFASSDLLDTDDLAGSSTGLLETSGTSSSGFESSLTSFTGSESSLTALGALLESGSTTGSSESSLLGGTGSGSSSGGESTGFTESESALLSESGYFTESALVSGSESFAESSFLSELLAESTSSTKAGLLASLLEPGCTSCSSGFESSGLSTTSFETGGSFGALLESSGSTTLLSTCGTRDKGTVLVI
jgi:hypothetical protein